MTAPTVAQDIPAGFEPIPFGTGFMDHIGPVYWRPGEEDFPLGFRVAPYHCNPAGICHGGMLMAVMDVALGVTVGFKAKVGAFTPTVNMTYDFLLPGQIGMWLESRVEFVHTTRRTGFANGYLFDGDTPILRANGICKLPSAKA